MADTAITRNSPQAVTLHSVSLQAESIRKAHFINQMSGPTPTQAMATAKREKQQTTSGMPIVQIYDLQQNAGDRVTMDMVKTMGGYPFMGDEKIEGRGQPLKFSQMEMVINQTRQAGDPGGNMTQKRTPHNLRTAVRANLSDYFARLNEQSCQVHMAGARGTDNAVDWVIPLESHERFKTIMINEVLPPTTNRYYCAGGAANANAIGVSDALTLTDLDAIASDLREQPLPPEPIKVEKDLEDNEVPLWCILMTERQWHYIVTQTGEGSFRKFQADASMRYQITKHPLFLGSAAMWNGMLLKRRSRPIRFKQGDVVKTTNKDTGAIISTTIDGTGATTIDRAIILGGQALAIAWGNAGNPNGPFPMKWSEESMDHGNSLEIAGAQMEGKKKIRYEGSDFDLTDFGCAVIDSYAPDPRSALGETLRNALSS